jgi:hypothetical protein
MSMTQNIQIIFEFATRHGTFRDALYLPVDHGLTDEQIAEIQRERLNNWLAVVEAPPTEEVPPTEEAPDA